MNSVDVLLVEDISKILRIAENTIHSKRWQEKSGCPLFKRGRRLYVLASEFWQWFRGSPRAYKV